METLIERCAGLDIGKAELKACVRLPETGHRRRQEIRTFATTTTSLLALREWLTGHGVTVVGMEATGDYWKPVFYLLEDTFDCQLLNARHMRNVPGRKTDVADSAWIARLVEHGLVRPSLVPPPPIRRLRDLTRYRTTVIQERTREVQRLHRVLEDAGIKLSIVASNIVGVSGRAMLEALLAGERDPMMLAEMARTGMRRKIPTLREALVGRFEDHHAFLCRTMLDRINAAEATVAALTSQIETEIAPFQDALTRLDTIPGVNTRIAEIIVAETGGDMTRFPTAGHLASWAGICPGNNESAGKHHSGRTRKGDAWLRGVLGEAASSASRVKASYLSARYRRLAGRRGTKRALVAVAHTILVAAWHILHNNINYRDLGADYYQRRQDPARQTARLVHQLQQLGHHVTLTPTG